MMEMEKVYEQASAAIDELFAAADTLKRGDILVIGCSTSEIVGKRIGSGSSVEAAKAVMDAVLPKIKARGLYLAVQCCEHLNRCLVVERECMEKFDLQQVWVKPQLHAGGAFSMEAVARFDDHVMVEVSSRQGLRRYGYRRYAYRYAHASRGSTRTRRYPAHRRSQSGHGPHPPQVCRRPQSRIR